MTTNLAGVHLEPGSHIAIGPLYAHFDRVTVVLPVLDSPRMAAGGLPDGDLPGILESAVVEDDDTDNDGQDQ